MSGIALEGDPLIFTVSGMTSSHHFVFNNYDENPRWRQDDVIPETVNINGSVSSAIPDIPLRFYTFDRNFEKNR